MKLIDGGEYTPREEYNTVFRRCQLCGTVIPYVNQVKGYVLPELQPELKFTVFAWMNCEYCECRTHQPVVGFKRMEEV